MRKMTTKSMRPRTLFLSAALLAVVAAAADAQECPAAPPEALQLQLQMDCGRQAPPDATRSAPALADDATQKEMAAIKEGMGALNKTVGVISEEMGKISEKMGAVEEIADMKIQMEQMKNETQKMEGKMKTVEEAINEVKQMLGSVLNVRSPSSR